MLMIVGKIQLMKLLRTRAGQLGDDFTIKKFCDDVVGTGQIPWSLSEYK